MQYPKYYKFIFIKLLGSQCISSSTDTHFWNKLGELKLEKKI